MRNSIRYAVVVGTLMCVLVLAACGANSQQQQPTVVSPPSMEDGERALRAVQAVAPYSGCDPEIDVKRTLPANNFNNLWIGCPAEAKYGDARWTARTKSTDDPDTWVVIFGGYSQSQISSLWSAKDIEIVSKWLSANSLAKWVWHWDRPSGSVHLIRADWPSAGTSVCGLGSPC
jgi:hypothetical protein